MSEGKPCKLRRVAAAMLRYKLRDSLDYSTMDFIRGYLAACLEAGAISPEEEEAALAALEPKNVTLPWWEREGEKP